MVSELPGFFAKLLLRASQLSSPAQKRVISVVRDAMDFGFSCPRCRACHSSRMLCLKAARASRPDNRLSDFSLLGTVSRIAWPILLAAELCGLGRQRPVAAHRSPESCRGMQLPGPPKN